MSKASEKSVATNLLVLRIKSSSSRVLMSILCSCYKLTKFDYVMNLVSSEKCSDYVRAHRFCDLITTESDYKLISAFHSSRIISMNMRRILSLYTLYVVSY